MKYEMWLDVFRTFYYIFYIFTKQNESFAQTIITRSYSTYGILLNTSYVSWGHICIFYIYLLYNTCYKTNLWNSPRSRPPAQMEDCSSSSLLRQKMMMMLESQGRSCFLLIKSITVLDYRNSTQHIKSYCALYFLSLTRRSLCFVQVFRFSFSRLNTFLLHSQRSWYLMKHGWEL